MKPIYSERNKKIAYEKKPIVGYFIGGYPDRESSLEIFKKAAAEGVDIFEIGYAADDPYMDGGVIRDAMARMDKSVREDEQYWKDLRETIQAPIWLMGYKADLVDTGKYLWFAENHLIDGLVIPDISVDEGRSIQKEIAPYQADVVAFIGPSSTLENAADCLFDFSIIYERLYDGPTGQSVDADNYHEILRLGHMVPNTYLYAGFGVSSPERVDTLIGDGFDGVIVGTAIIKAMDSSADQMYDFVRSLSDSRYEAIEKRYGRKKYILSADAGSTAVKVVLVTEQFEAVTSASAEVSTYFADNQIEQDPEEWYQAFCTAVKEILDRGYRAEDIIGVSFSGQMQDLILLGEGRRSVGRAILYSDARAQKEANEILKKIGTEELEGCFGNHFDGSMPFAKLRWVMKHQADVYAKTEKVVFSSKDYLIYKMTGETVSDVVTSSTVGLMDIREKTWKTEWLAPFGISEALLPDLKYPAERAGVIDEEGARATGLPVGTPVYTGSGDAGATTLASGIMSPGEYNINLGTTGWVASVSDHIMENAGVFNLASVIPGVYINVVPFYNAGNVHKWIAKALTPDGEQDKRYPYTAQLLKESEPGCHGTFFLPYLTGERYPVSDDTIKGAYVGITPSTTKQDMARACLEGVAYSLRSGFKTEIQALSLIGGGAREASWCQIFADALNHETMVFRNAEFLPAISVASMATIGSGNLTYQDFIAKIRHSSDCEVYKPDAKAVAVMDKAYTKFKRIYPAIKLIDEDSFA